MLANNEGFAVYDTIEEMSIDEARQQFEVNFFGLAQLTQKFIPYMREKNANLIQDMQRVNF